MDDKQIKESLIKVYGNIYLYGLACNQKFDIWSKSCPSTAKQNRAILKDSLLKAAHLEQALNAVNN